jgi:hypothetical protein
MVLPSRKGFGQTVLLRMAEDALDAKVRLNHEPAGLRWNLKCPAENALKA